MKLRASKTHKWEELSEEDVAVAGSQAHDEYCAVNNRALSRDEHVMAWLMLRCDTFARAVTCIKCKECGDSVMSRYMGKRGLCVKCLEDRLEWAEE